MQNLQRVSSSDRLLAVPGNAQRVLTVVRASHDSACTASIGQGVPLRIQVYVALHFHLLDNKTSSEVGRIRDSGKPLSSSALQFHLRLINNGSLFSPHRLCHHV